MQSFADQRGLQLDELQRLLEDARSRLHAAREERIHPLKDDKILTSWNGLMIAALAKGYQVLGDPKYAAAAGKAADFLLQTLRDPSGRLLRRYRDGHTAYRGFLDDYAFLVWGLLDLYEAVFDIRYLEEALRLNREMLELFWDETHGGCFFTPHDGEALIVRDKEIYDGAVPSGNSVAALNLLRLSRMTGDVSLEQQAERILQAFSGLVGDYPMAYTSFSMRWTSPWGPLRRL